MKHIKIKLTALAFVLGIGSVFASGLFPATLYVKTSSGECLKLCAPHGIIQCHDGINSFGYLDLKDCEMQNANFMHTYAPF